MAKMRQNTKKISSFQRGIDRARSSFLGILKKETPNPERKEPFWKTKTLEDMTKKEWEALCDGCGRCCLNKLEDQDTGNIHLTRLSCALLDINKCRCSDYANRFRKMPDCVNLTPKKIPKLNWLPRSCAYRRIHEGRDLAWWHPLISGDPSTVHKAGISVRNIARSEKGVKEENFTRYIIKRGFQL